MCAILVTIYIISFPGDVSTTLNMTIGCGCSHPCHSERKRGNPAIRRISLRLIATSQHPLLLAMTKGRFGYSACAHSALHQADNLAELWQEFCPCSKLIAKIFCAVVIARTSAVNGNRHCVAFLFRGFPRRFAPRNDIWGGCHNRNAV